MEPCHVVNSDVPCCPSSQHTETIQDSTIEEEDLRQQKRRAAASQLAAFHAERQRQIRDRQEKNRQKDASTVSRVESASSSASVAVPASLASAFNSDELSAAFQKILQSPGAADVLRNTMRDGVVGSALCVGDMEDASRSVTSAHFKNERSVAQIFEAVDKFVWTGPEPHAFDRFFSPVEDLRRLREYSTPSLADMWEQMTCGDPLACCSHEHVNDHLPSCAMVGYAVTLKIGPSRNTPEVSSTLRRFVEYVETLPNVSKIVVVQDLHDSRRSVWDMALVEALRVHSVVGCITDGGLRYVEEMGRVGFHAVGKGLCVAGARGVQMSWGCDVEAFGVRVSPAQLVHSDKHGFFVVPLQDEVSLVASINAGCQDRMPH